MIKKSILVQFSVVFLLFMFVIIALNAYNTYFIQRELHKENIENTLQHIASYLENLILMEGKKFLYMQDFMINNAQELKVPSNFTGEYWQEKETFDKMFANTYPGKVFEKDVSYEELSFDLKLLFTEYMFRKWLTIFEKAKEKFNIKYTYYLVPSEEYLHMLWVIDFHRGVSKYYGKDFINICADVFEPIEKHEKMWEAWNTGHTPKGYDRYDNQYGKTYAYYTPLIMNGEKCGIIGVEIESEKMHRDILYNSLRQILYMSIVTILCICIMLFLINRKYLSRIRNLQKYINIYATNKDAQITKMIDNIAMRNDEISLLAKSISFMIHEISIYTDTIKQTLSAFYAERKRANTMHRLAETDPLTGIKNKFAYDLACEEIYREIESKKANFAIAVIDLNNLKRINDNYGHEFGNYTIQKLCALICSTFDHFPVYRIGGDEFSVILKNINSNHGTKLLEQFTNSMKKLSSDTTLKPWERISAAIGIAYYDNNVDKNAESVFRRADNEMYTMKKRMKKVREN